MNNKVPDMTVTEAPANLTEALSQATTQVFTAAQLNQVLNTRATARLVGSDVTWLYRMRRAGLFPEPIKLGKRKIGWRLQVILDWLAERPRAKTKAT